MSRLAPHCAFTAVGCWLRGTPTSVRWSRFELPITADYAANGSAYWQAGRIAESYAASMSAAGRDADEVLSAFIGDQSAQEFWQQVDANFSAGRIKLVFVADTIPRELAQIVEFLNEQMKADVRAVELSWFESIDGTTALTPRVIGETQRAQVEKATRGALQPVGREAWIEARLAPCGELVVTAAGEFIALVETFAGRAEVTSSQGSIISEFDTADGVIYPFRLSPERKGTVQLCLAYLISRPAFAELQVRQEFYDELVKIVGPLSTTTMNGYPGFDARKLNDPVIKAELVSFLQALLELATR